MVEASFKINRAPVLTLWVTIVAERLGFDHNEALTLGRAVAGFNAYSKGKRLGIFKPSHDELHKKRSESDNLIEWLEFMQEVVGRPMKRTRSISVLMTLVLGIGFAFPSEAEAHTLSCQQVYCECLSLWGPDVATFRQ